MKSRSDIAKHPGDVLNHLYLTPNRCSLKEFSKLTKIGLDQLTRLLKEGKMSHATIGKISKITRTAESYWYYLQSNWLFQQYRSNRTIEDDILPIVRPTKIEEQKVGGATGGILQKKFIELSRKNYHAGKGNFRIYQYILNELVSGKQEITHKIAWQLGMTFGTTTQYWLDLKTACEAITLLNDRSTLLKEDVIQSLSGFCNKVFSKYKKLTTHGPHRHPGRMLLNQFIKPTGISVIYWQRLLCVSHKLLKSIIAGKAELPLSLIIKISRVFQTRIDFWIILQNRFYASKIEKECRKNIQKPVAPRSTKTLIHPVRLLMDRFLTAMRIPHQHFLRHVGIKDDKFAGVKRGLPRIDFEMAIRFGKALDMDPLYWVRLQLQYDIERYRAGDTATHLH
jgi:plasmid maintenance system antidote protein VapI